jgi:hypothetical protein
MASTILLFALFAPSQIDADEERRQVREIHLEYRLGDLDDRANHADAIYLDILARASSPVSADGLERGRENHRLLAENSRLPFDREGFVSYLLKLRRLAEGYAEVERDLAEAGRPRLADHARRQAELWSQRAGSMLSALERSKAKSERIARMRASGELGTQAQALREQVNPIFRLFRFLGTIPPLHAIAVFAALALACSRIPRRRVPPSPESQDHEHVTISQLNHHRLEAGGFGSRLQARLS